MAVEIRVPTLGESVTEATIAKWLKTAGDTVAADEPLVELETDKVSIEASAPSAGVLSEIIANEGDTVEVNALLGTIEAGQAAGRKKPLVLNQPPRQRRQRKPQVKKSRFAARRLGDLLGELLQSLSHRVVGRQHGSDANGCLGKRGTAKRQADRHGRRQNGSGYERHSVLPLVCQFN